MFRDGFRLRRVAQPDEGSRRPAMLLCGTIRDSDQRLKVNQPILVYQAVFG